MLDLISYMAVNFGKSLTRKRMKKTEMSFYLRKLRILEEAFRSDAEVFRERINI